MVAQLANGGYRREQQTLIHTPQQAGAYEDDVVAARGDRGRGHQQTEGRVLNAVTLAH